MKQATLQMQTFARRLIENEANGVKSLRAKNAAAFEIYEKLRPQLEPLVGKSGFRSLLSRALTLATMEISELRTMQVRANGALEGPKEVKENQNSTKVYKGRVVFLAHLLGLLVAFIGRNLTVRLMNEIWPNVTLDDLDLEEGERK